jgi:F0F1-type ATP synthase membrane subunit b/b'
MSKKKKRREVIVRNIRTIKNLREQAKALLEEADKINECDKMVGHEIEPHVQTITCSDL